MVLFTKIVLGFIKTKFNTPAILGSSYVDNSSKVVLTERFLNKKIREGTSDLGFS